LIAMNINFQGRLIAQGNKKNKKGKLVIYNSMVEQVSMYSIAWELKFKKRLKQATVVLLDRHEIDYLIRVVKRDEIQAVFDNVCVGAISAYRYYHKEKRRKKK